MFRFQILLCFFFFSFNHPATTEIYTLSLHDALPIWMIGSATPSAAKYCSSFLRACDAVTRTILSCVVSRSEEHTSELQSRVDLVCRLLLEKKKKKKHNIKKLNT